jgi:hypothetical protein
VGKDGDNSKDTDSGKGAVPKLTVGQRVLTALPNLQRQPKQRPVTPPRRDTRGAGQGANGAGRSDAGDVVEPDEVLAPGSDPTASGGRLRDSFSRSAAPRQPRGAPSGMSREQLTDIIKRLDDRERFLALVSAPLGVVVGLLLTIGAIHYNPPVHVKNHVSTGVILFEGGARVLLSGILVLATVTRRRSFVAFALLFLGTSMGFPFALPFWALGIWLIFRVFKWQRELTTLTGGAARSRAEPRSRATITTSPAARGRESAEARRRARADRTGARSGGRGAKNKKKPEPPGPPPSKRYTPPNTVRPKPPIP